MKEVIQPQQQNQLAIMPQLIKATLPIATICLIFGIGGVIAVFSQKPKNTELINKLTQDEMIETVDKTQLPPYTMIVEGESVVVKFHQTDSNMQFNNLSNIQKTCLANGGGVGCVLPGYVSEKKTKDTEPTPKPGMERRASSMSLFVEENWLILGLAVGLAGHLVGIFKRKN